MAIARPTGKWKLAHFVALVVVAEQCTSVRSGPANGQVTARNVVRYRGTGSNSGVCTDNGGGGRV